HPAVPEPRPGIADTGHGGAERRQRQADVGDVPGGELAAHTRAGEGRPDADRDENRRAFQRVAAARALESDHDALYRPAAPLIARFLYQVNTFFGAVAHSSSRPPMRAIHEVKCVAPGSGRGPGLGR